MTEESTQQIQNEDPKSAPASSARRVEVATPTAVGPGNAGSINHKASGGRLVGVEVEEGSQLLRIMAGTRVLSLKPGQSWGDVLAGGVDLAGVSYVIAIVQNDREEPRTLRATLLVEGGVAGGAQAAAPSTATANATQVPMTSEVVRGEVLGEPVRRRGVTGSIAHHVVGPTPLSDYRNVGEQTGSVQVRRTFNGETNHVVPGSTPRTPSGAARHLSGEEVRMVLPNEGERAVLLLKGHAYAVVRLLQSHVPLHPSFRPAIVKQLQDAQVRVGAVGVQRGGAAEVCFVLTDEDVRTLAGYVNRTVGMPDEGWRRRVAGAILSALEPAAPKAGGDVVEARPERMLPAPEHVLEAAAGA